MGIVPLDFFKKLGEPVEEEETVLACRVNKDWNRLPLAVASILEQLAFKRQLDTYIYP